MVNFYSAFLGERHVTIKDVASELVYLFIAIIIFS